MNMDELEGMLEWCSKNLQGYYGRCKANFDDMPEDRKRAVLDDVNAHHVESVVDFIMYMEVGE